LITKDDITSQHGDLYSMRCTSNIIFCAICCFRSASWRTSSLKGVVNCRDFYNDNSKMAKS